MRCNTTCAPRALVVLPASHLSVPGPVDCLCRSFSCRTCWRIGPGVTGRLAFRGVAGYDWAHRAHGRFATLLLHNMTTASLRGSVLTGE